MVSLVIDSALSTNARRKQTSRGISLPPPVGGLNYIDELSNMDARDALILDNIFPLASFVELRRGYESHATGMGAGKTIKSLMEWAGPSSRKLKAAVDGKIYDVTVSGAVGAAELSGLTVDQWQHVNFKTAGGAFLVMCNGTDAVRNYDGTTWTSPSITGSGLTSANLINVAVFKSRLWFVEKNSTNAWFLPVNSIAGAATQQDLGAQFTLGGSLIAIGSISQDSGDGIDDFLVFVSSRGQFAVYQGTDPTSANSWALIGTYRVGYPIGYRCLTDVGGDLGILNADGVVSSFQAMKNDRSTAQRMAITNKIQKLISDYTYTYANRDGWSSIVYPKNNQVIFNIPLSTTRFIQLVMNTDTGAWCRFTNINAFCWSLLGDDLYFGDANGTVWLADTGYQDNGGAITGELKTAWNYVGSRGNNKFFNMVRPVIQVTGSPSVLFAYDVDFNNTTPTGTINPSGQAATVWGSALWGSAIWDGALAINTEWYSPGTIGYCGSAHLIVTSNNNRFILNSLDIQVLPGGPI